MGFYKEQAIKNDWKVVFTGPAFDAQGNSVLRSDLTEFAQMNGYTVLRSMTKDANLLVASRKDTVKAKKAMERGVSVITYPEFIKLMNSEGVVPVTGGEFDPIVDETPVEAKIRKGEKPPKSSILQLVLGL